MTQQIPISKIERTRRLRQRVRALYATGGLPEIGRGVRDWLLVNTDLPLEPLLSDATLSIKDVEVEIGVDCYEEAMRARGHGEQAPMADFVTAVSASDTVWDVGANIGSYSLLAAASGAEVVAFEPGARARYRIVENAQRNGLAELIDATPVALADYDGEATLATAERMGVRQLTDGGDGDTVPVRRGDGLGLPHPDVLKIDVEGGEIAALDGLGDVLKSVDRAYVEIHDDVDPLAVHDRLNGAGLSVFHVWPGTDTDRIVRADR